MSLGGGTYTVQNKILGGAYFKFSSVAQATAVIADRGVSAMALEMNWGVDGDIRKITANDFMTNSIKLFGYEYDADELVALRELFLHTKEAYIYKLNDGEKASCAFCTAKYKGTRGNDLNVVINEVDDKFSVALYLKNYLVSSQIVDTASELIDNDFVEWNDDAELAETAGTPLEGGTNYEATSANHQVFLNKLEKAVDVNAVGYVGNDDLIKQLYANWVKTMRNEVGVRMQAVMYGYPADNYSVVNVKNQENIVPWVTGVIAGTAVNASATNMTYDGELTVNTDYTQRELENAITNGEWTLHAVGDEVRVLEDINSFTSSDDEVGDVFKDNQTIRVIDTIANSIASVFASKYLGKVPNDNAGRISLWSDIVKIHNDLNDIRALEGFDAKQIQVLQGDTKKSVLVKSNCTVVNTMVRLYVDTVIQ